MNEITKELLEALKTIESWDSHATAYAVDSGSNGVRDFYRAIARQSIAKAEAALAATQSPYDDWIPWEGGECPVARRAVVMAKAKDGEVDTDKAYFYDWDHTGSPFDIIAYRVVKP